MRVLAFDTSMAALSVAVHQSGEGLLAAHFEEMETGQAERLMPAIDNCLGAARLRLADIDRCKPANTRVALRTAPHMAWGGNAMLSLNRVIREVAQERKLPLLDYDLAAWALGTSEAELFRDANHPNVRVSTAFANSIVADLAPKSLILWNLQHALGAALS